MSEEPALYDVGKKAELARALTPKGPDVLDPVRKRLAAKLKRLEKQTAELLADHATEIGALDRKAAEIRAILAKL